jgi:hypothetical protein
VFWAWVVCGRAVRVWNKYWEILLFALLKILLTISSGF